MSLKKSAHTNKVNKKKPRMSIDVVTGKKVVKVYFNPEKCLDISSLDHEWVDENIFSQASIVTDECGISLLKLMNGDLVKMNSEDVVVVADQDYEGVNDILLLRSFSEMSLINTLRTRYLRDEIYTFVGPILISINPYKVIDKLYDDNAIGLYHLHHEKKTVRSTTHCLFIV